MLKNKRKEFKLNKVTLNHEYKTFEIQMIWTLNIEMYILKNKNIYLQFC